MYVAVSLAGTVAFGISGGLAAVRGRLDAFGVVSVAVVAAVAGGIARDLLIGIPSVAFQEPMYLLASAIAGLICCVVPAQLNRTPSLVLFADALGLGLFCVTGTARALAHGLSPVSAAILGMITGVGGGVVRDLLLRELPLILRSDIYAIPALLGASVFAAGDSFDFAPPGVAAVAALVCVGLRLVGIRYQLQIPRPASGMRRADRAEGKTRRPSLRRGAGQVRSS